MTTYLSYKNYFVQFAMSFFILIYLPSCSCNKEKTETTQQSDSPSDNGKNQQETLDNSIFEDKTLISFDSKGKPVDLKATLNMAVPYVLRVINSGKVLQQNRKAKLDKDKMVIFFEKKVLLKLLGEDTALNTQDTIAGLAGMFGIELDSTQEIDHQTIILMKINKKGKIIAYNSPDMGEEKWKTGTKTIQDVYQVAQENPGDIEEELKNYLQNQILIDTAITK